jgi:hypothetical protein
MCRHKKGLMLPLSMIMLTIVYPKQEGRCGTGRTEPSVIIHYSIAPLVCL